MRHEIILAPEAVEDLAEFDAHWRAIVKDAIEEHLRHQPEKVSKSRIKRLRGFERPQYRLRVGEIRIFYDVTSGRVEVLGIIPKPLAGKWLTRWEKRNEDGSSF